MGATSLATEFVPRLMDSEYRGYRRLDEATALRADVAVYWSELFVCKRTILRRAVPICRGARNALRPSLGSVPAPPLIAPLLTNSSVDSLFSLFVI